MNTQGQKIEAFKQLHLQSEAFLIPNPWDSGSALRLQSLGYKALASTSSGFAFTLGRNDMQVTLDEKLIHLESICANTDIPVNADLEKCFADDPRGVSDCIQRAIPTGIAGASIEDATGDVSNPIFDFNHAVERVAAAVDSIKQSSVPIVLTARAENLLWGKIDLDDTISRLQAFSEAGADVLYAPGLNSLDQVHTVCAAFKKPVNVLATMVKDATVEELSSAGAKRISVGGALARAAIHAELNAAREMLNSGSFSWIQQTEPGSSLEQLMPASKA